MARIDVLDRQGHGDRSDDHGHRPRDVLRVLTCGSVDDGKSTLLGRLLYDCGQVYDDQLAQLERDSARHGKAGDALDLSFLVDGLMSEREQGITIDVAYRYFSTPARKFIVADTPGHEQYTRNMATGASVSQVAILLVDASKGLLTQTRRHSCICALLGIRHVVLAVNKMDLIDFDEAAYRAIEQEYTDYAGSLGLTGVDCVPVSARDGDNVVHPGNRMAWYEGPTLLALLEGLSIADEETSSSFRLPVQWINRPNDGFRGFSGTICEGSISVGDGVEIYPSRRKSKVSSILSATGEKQSAGTGDAVTLTLADEVDVSRGNVIVAGNDLPEVADQISANLIWMSDEPMLPGRPYALKCGTQWATATVTAMKHKIGIDTLDPIAGRELELNDIGHCSLSFDRQIVFDPYSRNRTTGSFILVDKVSNETVGAGLIEFGLRRAANLKWQSFDIDKSVRAAAKGQRPCCLWMTGLSGAGKSSIANALERTLYSEARHTFILDGDNVRHGLNRDLGFTDADRVENIRRVAEVARLFTESGLIVIVSFISPFRAERQMARELFDKGDFLEIHVDTPLEVCEERDPKGLYQKARSGEIKNFTGIDSDYEPPLSPDIVLKAGSGTPESHATEIMRVLRARGIV